MHLRDEAAGVRWVGGWAVGGWVGAGGGGGGGGGSAGVGVGRLRLRR